MPLFVILLTFLLLFLLICNVFWLAFSDIIFEGHLFGGPHMGRGWFAAAIICIIFFICVFVLYSFALLDFLERINWI
uniref:Uncharacterized protein n=1 Tax=Meloidogyne enterolobii TaxID=390850 RepID=A0A6V7V680_MELEN|nr:unnamed protein product [Meloidogyne enterolobii]